MSLPSREFYKALWEQGVQKGELKLHTERVKDLLKEEFPPEVWIVDKLVPDEAVTIISGSPGSFKTWLLLEIVVKVASGGMLFQQYSTKQTSVLVIDEESGKRRLQNRFKQLGASEETPIHFTSRVGYKMNQLYADAITSKARELNAGLIVFDSFTRFNKGDENASGEMSKLMDYYHQLADAGFAVLILHHNRKEAAGQYNNPAQAMRGSSDILASADCHIAVSRKGQSEFVKIQQTKNRDVWEETPFDVRFFLGAKEFEYVGSDKTPAELHREKLDEVVSAVIANPGLSKTKLQKLIRSQGATDGEKKIGEYLDELVNSGEIELTPGSRNGYQYFPLILPSDEEMKTSLATDAEKQ